MKVLMDKKTNARKRVNSYFNIAKLYYPFSATMPTFIVPVKEAFLKTL